MNGSKQNRTSFGQLALNTQNPTGLHIDATTYLDFCNSADQVKNWSEFELWCENRVRPIMQYERMIAATGRVFGGLLAIDKLLGLRYPPEFMETVALQGKLASRRFVGIWLQKRAPIKADLSNLNEMLSDLEQQEFHFLNMQSLIAHGVLEPDGLKGSYFSFAGCPTEPQINQFAKIEMLVLRMHQAMSKLMWQEQKPQLAEHKASRLSPRELQVLNLLAQGHSNPSIALKLHRSDQTIKHQVSSVIKKLGVSSRTEAAVAAGRYGIIIC
jgi:DNA-binding CsgD family transcriptional regulator